MKMVKIAASAAIRQYMPTGPREGSFQSTPRLSKETEAVLIDVLYSYFQSGSSGCLRSHNGRRLLTVGTTAKL